MPTPTVFPKFKLAQHNGNAVDLDTDTIKVAWVTNAWTPNLATNEFWGDISANEVSGTGYTAGGSAIAGVTLALDGNTMEWAHNDLSWAQNAAGFSNGRYAVWYKDTGVAGTSRLIMYLNAGADVGNVAGPLTLDGDAATGVLQAA